MSTARIEIRLLGRPSIQIGGVRIGPESAMLFGGLLRLGLDETGVVDREALASCLWPKASSDTSRRQSLRQLLYRARQAGVSLAATGSNVTIDRELVDIDTRTLLARGLTTVSLEEVQRLSGGVLTGFDPDWSRPMAHWVDVAREAELLAIRRGLVSALAALEGLPHWQRIEVTARALQKLDPYNRSGVVALAAVHEHRGESTIATALLDEFEREVPPADGQLPIRLLVRRWSRGASMAKPTSSEVSLHGRARELEAIGQLLRNCVARVGGIVVVAGDGGMGKSRLLREATGVGARLGMRVVHRTVDSSGFLRPLALWTSITRDVLQFQGVLGASEEALRLCREVATGEVDHDQTRVVVALGDLLCAVASERPVLLAVDDLHQAGEGVWDCVQRLGSAVATARVAILLASRHSTVSVQTVPEALLLPLEPLDDAAATALVDALAEKRHVILTPEARDECVAISGGQPLFAEELVGLLADESASAAVARSLEDTIRRRVGLLPSDSRDLLPLLAALDAHWTLERLQRLSGWAPLRIVQAIDKLERHQFLRPQATAPRVLHSLVRSVILGSMAGASRSVLHRAVVAELLSDGTASNDPRVLVSCAHHLLQAGAHDDAVALAEGAVSVVHKDGMSHVFSELLAVAEATRNRDRGREVLRQIVNWSATTANSLQGLTAIEQLALRPKDTAAAAAMVRELGPSSVEVLKRTTQEWSPLLAGTMSSLLDRSSPTRERLEAAAVLMVLGADLADTAFMESVMRGIETEDLREAENPDAYLRSVVIYHVTCGDLREAVRMAERLVSHAASSPDRGRHSRALTYLARATRIAGDFDAAMLLHSEAFEVARSAHFASRALGAAIEALQSVLQANSSHHAARWLTLAAQVEPFNKDTNYGSTLAGLRLRTALLLGTGELSVRSEERTIGVGLAERQRRPRAQMMADRILLRLYRGERVPAEEVRSLTTDTQALFAQTDMDCAVAALRAALISTGKLETADDVRRDYLAKRRDVLPPPPFLDSLPFTRWSRPRRRARGGPA